MEREQLKRWLDQGLSLPQIGALVKRDPSTVGYWVQKHGLVANGNAKYSPRGGLMREQLEPLVAEGATLKEIAERLNRSMSTARYWLLKYGLKTEGHRRHRPIFRRADQAGLTRLRPNAGDTGRSSSSSEATAGGAACAAALRMS
jgi:hypothetical protein